MTRNIASWASPPLTDGIVVNIEQVFLDVLGDLVGELGDAGEGRVERLAQVVTALMLRLSRHPSVSELVRRHGVEIDVLGAADLAGGHAGEGGALLRTRAAAQQDGAAARRPRSAAVRDVDFGRRLPRVQFRKLIS